MKLKFDASILSKDADEMWLKQLSPIIDYYEDIKTLRDELSDHQKIDATRDLEVHDLIYKPQGRMGDVTILYEAVRYLEQEIRDLEGWFDQAIEEGALYKTHFGSYSVFSEEEQDERVKNLEVSRGILRGMDIITEDEVSCQK